jgi:hypothetical protein
MTGDHPGFLARTVVKEAIQKLKQGQVKLEELEYKVELREDPLAKSKDRTLPQPYQAALLVRNAGGSISRGEEVGSSKSTLLSTRTDTSQSSPSLKQASAR